MIENEKVTENRYIRYFLAIPRYLQNRLSDRWYSRTVLDKKLIRDLVDFYNYKMNCIENPLKYRDAAHLVRIASRINDNLWNILAPGNEEEIKHFYKITPWYMFQLAYWHMSGYQKLYRSMIAERCFGRVLDYGGGIGDLSLKLAQKGLQVTYAEVEGMNFEFARWSFTRNNQNIKILNLSQSLDLPEKYNVIICLDVIGQVTNPEEVLNNLGNHLEENGRLIITQLNHPGSKEINPPHLRLDFNAERLFKSLNLIKVRGLPKYLTILEKKTNFGK